MTLGAQRRPGRPTGGKRAAPGAGQDAPAKVRAAYRRSLDPCDNSNDSGLGFDHNDIHHHHTPNTLWTGERLDAKRSKMDIKLEYEDVNDNYSFPDSSRLNKDNMTLIRTAPVGSTAPALGINTSSTSSSGRASSRYVPPSSKQASVAPVPLTTQLSCTSRYGDISLVIVKQPEQQHRARYQTEGSRGAVKDREGNGFPIVRLTGYYKPTTLQVYIGTDVGKVAPHMFYQACKVSGKNSTPCVEKKIDGTCVIELSLEPSKEMSATCDCVGILKERNVDVEHRFPDQLGNRSKKKSTRCRMIFRSTITLENGTQETLQVCSQPIVCTQPPGIPEICKKSLTSCPATGGLELFVIGKNFLKDTKVFFQEFEEGAVKWEMAVSPDKEYLQQTHFVCVIPPYQRPDITEPIPVRLCVVSSGKTSETQQFVYTPINGAVASVPMDNQHAPPTNFLKGMMWQSARVSKREQDLGMMPPPETNLVPLSNRRPSITLPSSSDANSPPLHNLKQEYIDENSQSSVADPMDMRHERYRHLSESSLDVNHGDSNMSMINENSVDMANHGSMLKHLNENSNLSVANDNSIDITSRRNSLSQSNMQNDDSLDMMVHCNSMSRPVSVCDNSVDVNIGSTNMSLINEDSSCSTAMHNGVLNERMMIPQPQDSTCSVMEKVMDLRMKNTLTTVADLVSTPSTSIETLQRFDLPLNAPLPAQSAQSIENYLTKIESKPNPTASVKDQEKSLRGMPTEEPNFPTSKLLNSQVMMPAPICELPSTIRPPIPEPESVFNLQRTFLPAQGEAIDIVAKSNQGSITETGPTNVLSTIASSLEHNVPTPINTEKLDALVNSTVESHIGSPVKLETSPTHIMSDGADTGATSGSNQVIMQQDIMLTSQPQLLVPTMLSTKINSPVLTQQDTQNLSPEVILNSRLSPSMMCKNSSVLPQENLLPNSTLSTICQPPTLDSNMVSTAQSAMMAPQTSRAPENYNTLHSSLFTSDSEKVLLKAAVDLFETQKRITEYSNAKDMITTVNNEIDTTLRQLQNGNENGFMSARFPETPGSNGSLVPKTLADDKKSEFSMPMGQRDVKKGDDRMIPQSFTSLTENELINLINPSCFDQGNNYH